MEKRRGQAEQQSQLLRGQLEQQRLEWQGLVVRRKALQEQLAEDGYDLHTVLANLPLDASERDWEERLESLAARIQRLGPINLAAIEEYQQQSERKRYLDSQNDDLAEALETLENVIRKIDRETRNRFKETFDQINAGLQALFPKVFGGGTAYLELTGEDLLDTGVAIMARPPGKKNSTIHLLSGGGKGADRAGAGIRHLPVEPGAVLHARRSRCAIGRCQRRTLCAIGEGDVGKGAVHLYHPQQDRHGNGRSVDGRDHA
ncbi:chromosome segregation protein SMC [Pseudomonas aeruginosa]|nr:chromosome segregation protein SMC [Pseudomonas aeruginosa]